MLWPALRTGVCLRQNIRVSALNWRPLLIIHKSPRYRLSSRELRRKKMSVMPHAQVQVLIKPILIELVQKIYSVITSFVCFVLADAMRGFGLLMSNQTTFFFTLLRRLFC